MYIVIDAEMGGIDLKYSLLTAYFGVFDEDFNFIDKLYLYLKPDDGVYSVSAQGMEINGIDLVKHDKVAITYNNGRSALGAFLRKHSPGGEHRLTCVGHNVTTDLRCIWDKVYAREKWEEFVSYRVLDTSPICQFLIAKGVLPYDVQGKEGVSGSLESLAAYLGVPITGNLHDAKVDAHLTIGVLQALLKLDLVKGKYE
jgi:hypothetical protein